MKANTKSIFYILASILTVAVMVGFAEILNQSEIIFPEISAIAVGMILAPKRSWQTSKIRIVVLITICAVSGVAIVRYVPLDKWMQMLIAFAVCQLIFSFSKTSFAPMISAAVLPVMLDTESIIYPISAVLLTLMIIGIVTLLEKLGLKQTEEFTPLPHPDKHDFLNILLRCIIAGAVIFSALTLDFKFAVAPPILVAFTEFSKPECKARTKPIKAVMLITLCALAGALSRLLCSVYLGLPLTISSVLAILITAIIMYCFKMFLPPAGALAILPMIVPLDSLLIYPLEVLAGTGLLMALALVIFRKPRKIIAG